MRFDEPDRDRGMLAPVDRKWLMGEKEYTHRQSDHDRRQMIRKRVRNTMLDFSVLLNYMDSDLRRQIFGWGGSEKDSPPYQIGVRDAIALLYLSQYEQGIPFQRVLQWSIDRAWHEIAPEMNVDVNFDVEIHEPEWHDPVELAERARDEGVESLSEDEAATLMDYAGVEGLLDGVLDGLIDSRENRRDGADEPDGG